MMIAFTSYLRGSPFELGTTRGGWNGAGREKEREALMGRQMRALAGYSFRAKKSVRSFRSSAEDG
jgi:hypothetical protein